LENNNKEIYLLFRKDHLFYEVPGGKINSNECQNPKHPTLQELKVAAQRELFEEVSGITKVTFMDYFSKTEFQTPTGKKYLSHLFITKIIGQPVPNEDIFDKEKSQFIPLVQLEKYPLSMNLKLFLPLIKKQFG